MRSDLKSFRELTRPADFLEILEEEEISDRCWHGTFPEKSTLRED